MNKMVCEDCLTIYYSAAARTLVERRQPCPKCGGRLILDDEGPPEPPLSLVTGEARDNPGEERRAGGDRRRADRRTGRDRRQSPGRFTPPAAGS